MSGPFTTRRAVASGVSLDILRRRSLSRPFHGVRATVAPVDLLDRCRAYQEWMPEHAFFCSVTAALLMGAPLPRRLERDPRLHVAVPAPAHPPEGRGVVGHRVTLAADDVGRWCGLRVSSPERVWCELASVLTLPDLVAVGDYLIHHRQPFTTQPRLRNALAAYSGRRGRRALRAAIELLSDRAESRRESLLRVIIVQASIPGLAVNFPIVTSGGFSYRADLAFPGRKVLVEYQSEYHRDEAQRRRDMTRRSRLEADGWFVIEVNADDLRDAAELAQRIRRVLAARPHFL